MRSPIALYLIVLSVLWPDHASAHPLTPAGLWIEETLAGSAYELTFRRPQRFATQLILELPRSCSAGPARRELVGDQLVEHSSLRCERPLQGQALAVLGLAELSLVAVVQAQFSDGRQVREVLSPERLSMIVPAQSYRLHVFLSYLELGVEHLLTGWDHLLFVIGILCLTSGLRRVIWTLTAFTLGHSVTLVLSALGIVRWSQALVEVAIAASLGVVAVQISQNADWAKPETRPLRTPSFRLAGAFGLLHGLGFAGALADIGLPQGQLPLALTAFNLGIEAGQLLVVSVLLPLFWLTRRLGSSRLHTARLSLAYVIGSLSVMWCIERVAELLG